MISIDSLTFLYTYSCAMIISSSASSEKSDLVSPLEESIFGSPIVIGSRLVVDSNNDPPAVPIERTVEPPKAEHQDQDEGLFTPTIRQSLDECVP